MVLVKKLKFFHLSISGKLGQKNEFDDIQERKKASPDYKTTSSKKWKNWNFFKVVSPWFWSKK